MRGRDRIFLDRFKAGGCADGARKGFLNESRHRDVDAVRKTPKIFALAAKKRTVCGDSILHAQRMNQAHGRIQQGRHQGLTAAVGHFFTAKRCKGADRFEEHLLVKITLFAAVKIAGAERTAVVAAVRQKHAKIEFAHRDSSVKFHT